MSNTPTLYRDAEMYEADEGTGSMEQDAELRWVVPVEPVGTFRITRPKDYVAGIPLSVGEYMIVRLGDE